MYEQGMFIKIVAETAIVISIAVSKLCQVFVTYCNYMRGISNTMRV